VLTLSDAYGEVLTLTDPRDGNSEIQVLSSSPMLPDVVISHTAISPFTILQLPSSKKHGS